MGCLQAQQRSFPNSLSEYSKRVARNSQTLLRTSPIPTKPTGAYDEWRTVTLRNLDLLATSPEPFKWVPTVRSAVSTWKTQMDIRWRENLKWFYLHSDHKSPESDYVSKDREKSIWVIPGLFTDNIFQASSYTEFLSRHLHCADTHAIAMMIQSFLSAFIETYSSPPECEDGKACEALTEAMKRDVMEFSTVAVDALERYYGEIDILTLFRKSKQYLAFMIREVVLEHPKAHFLLLEAIRIARKPEDAAIIEHYGLMGACSLEKVNSQVKPVLLQVANSDPGFNAAISILQDFPTIPRIRDQILAIYRLSQVMNDAINFVYTGEEQIRLDSDDMMTLFIYFLMRAAAPDIGMHIELLSSLVPNDVMADLTSYSLATLECALGFIATKINSNKVSE